MPALRGLLLTGLLVGVVGTLAFGTVHALAIIPIWTRLVRGLPLAIPVGIVIAWAYHEYLRRRPSARPLSTGLRFGVLCWLASLPAWIIGFGSRVLSNVQIPWWVDPLTVVAGGAGGAVLLWLLAGTRRAAIAGALAIAVSVVHNGGPMPIEHPERAYALVLGFLGIQMLGGVAVALGYSRLVSAPARLPTQ